MRSEGFKVGFRRRPRKVPDWFCGYVNFKDAPGKEDKAYDFMNAWLAHPSAKGLLENFGYASANSAAMKEIPMERLTPPM